RLPIAEPGRRRAARQALEHEIDAAAAALAQGRAERKGEGVNGRRPRVGEQTPRGVDRRVFEVTAADRAFGTARGDKHLGARLPRGGAAQIRHRHEDEGPLLRDHPARRRLPCHRSGLRSHGPAPYRAAIAHGPPTAGRATVASCRARARIASIASSTRSDVAGASRSGTNRWSTTLAIASEMARKTEIASI